MLPSTMEPLSARTLRRITTLQGFDWTEEDLERLLPAVERALELIGRLDALPLREVEPPVVYRMPADR
jgi:hypothetical protein